MAAISTPPFATFTHFYLKHYVKKTLLSTFLSLLFCIIFSSFPLFLPSFSNLIPEPIGVATPKIAFTALQDSFVARQKLGSKVETSLSVRIPFPSLYLSTISSWTFSPPLYLFFGTSVVQCHLPATSPTHSLHFTILPLSSTHLIVSASSQEGPKTGKFGNIFQTFLQFYLIINLLLSASIIKNSVPR